MHGFAGPWKPLKIPALIVGGVILAALVALLLGLFVQWLWNWLMPDIFGLKTISFWQAWGLVLLSHILFKAGAIEHHAGRHHKTSKTPKLPNPPEAAEPA